jgi:predicted metal-dependent HD superfamily phosphohydrolase
MKTRSLIKERFRNLFEQISAKGDWKYFFNKLANAYETPFYKGHPRFYHTLLGHIPFCLKQLDEFPEYYVQDKNALEMAIFLHDAIMVFGATDNEEKSAELAIRLCREMGLAQEFGEKAAKLIIDGTKHDRFPEDNNARAMADIDLAVLGQNPKEYRKLVEERIRKEFSFVSEEDFKKRRAEILKRFLDRKSIYLTQHFQDRYEAMARRNLRRSIKSLGKKGE